MSANRREKAVTTTYRLVTQARSDKDYTKIFATAESLRKQTLSMAQLIKEQTSLEGALHIAVACTTALVDLTPAYVSTLTEADLLQLMDRHAKETLVGHKQFCVGFNFFCGEEVSYLFYLYVAYQHEIVRTTLGGLI